MRRLALSVLLAIAFAPSALAQLPSAKTVDLGGGIHVIFGQGGNIGVSTGPDGVFVIDDQYPGTAPANLAKIKEIAGAGPRYLVNTHWHGDHAGGNAAFAEAGAMIFAHENVRKRLSGQLKSIGLNGQPAPASPEPAWPVVTFTSGVDFHLNDETILVSKMRVSHTDGDSIIRFVEPNIIHAGDIFFNGIFPVIDLGSGGSVKGYLAAMEEIWAMADDKTRIIPGHGDMAAKADLRKQIDMLTGAIAAVEKHVKAGDSLQKTVAAKPLKPWSKYAWSFISEDSFTTTLYNGLKQ
jgi:glyoxylase-like metal-dependent hydrolase (beta-lactamase superfamily II)